MSCLKLNFILLLSARLSGHCFHSKFLLHLHLVISVVCKYRCLYYKLIGVTVCRVYLDIRCHHLPLCL